MKLYEHNQIAYNSALTLMEDTGKAAVIHPTGTGKSFVAFFLCEEHPDSVVCWLSPSEYIFQTQKENWIKAGGKDPQNIRFFTYAKLLLLEAEELRGLNPDYIVLDEFHRCGARMWGQGVQSLLEACPDVPLLGLSATNIRYLDNQRDMAEELFGGSIASEMTLGEAIVRGILNPPKYVLSVYSYQKELEQYETRVRSCRGKAAKRAAEEALEALRRALEMAEGMEEMFLKHMPDTAGKYIVFCANYDHMQEMMEKATEWFGKVDQAPHIYSVYSEEPGADQAFREFKEDESRHLKLLFCIDMLNEGIHVEDVSGVILLRPTVSPIIYKQQIGRALSASKKKDAVIFDVVLNIKNLYSISAVEEEMQEAVEYIRASGKEEEIVHQNFRILDEAHDCISLFRQLEGALGASWDLMYASAKDYYKKNGNLEVPKRYKTPEGFSLGQWLDTQRRVYAHKVSGALSKEQIEQLNEIGMRWQGGWDAAWEKNFAEAEKYYQEHGNLLIEAREKSGGVALGRWIAQLRTYRKNPKGNACLTPERIRALDGIGMVWDISEYLWEKNYASAENYYREHGDLNVPAAYVDEEGIRLGAWIARMREAKKYPGEVGLTAEQAARLEDIGMAWGPKREVLWEKSYRAAGRYYEEHGNLEIPVAYGSREEGNLGKWIRHQREAFQQGKLDKERQKKLEAIGMSWEADNRWEKKFALAKEYYETHGNLELPLDYVVEGVWLGKWVREQRMKLEERETPEKEADGEHSDRRKKGLTQEQAQKLISLGVGRQVSKSEAAWQRQCRAAGEFYQEYGHLQVPRYYQGADGKDLSLWVRRQRERGRKGLLTEEQRSLLREAGITWKNVGL